MEPIDTAYKCLEQLSEEIENYATTISSEQDTRAKVIDRLLTEVLGWPLAEIHTEERAGTGYIDYKLTCDQFARVILEAKRDGRELGIKNSATGRAYKLNGPVFQSPNVREGIDQTIRYCGHKNAELACVTNGHEWIVFRGSRLGDGIDTLEGMAFVFPSLTTLKNNFVLFYNLLGYDNVRKFQYRAHFQEAEGRPIRAHEFRKALSDSNSRRLLSTSELAGDIDRIMTSFFRRLSGDSDPEFLAKCFVITKESQSADKRLARISEDLAGRVRKLDTENAEELTTLIERVKGMQRNEFVLLIGTKGAGKSTFIDRFFRYVLPRQIAGECIVARVNMADSEGNDKTLTSWLDQKLLGVLEESVFGEEGPSFDELQGMFFDEYRRQSNGTLRHLYEKDKNEFKIEFGRFIEQRREDRPHEYISRMVRHIVASRRKIPCIVFDNADHFTVEFQERVFQYARSIYEGDLCLIIMPITDRTSWQLSYEGALRSFENESLFLPTPLPSVILKKRINFLELRLTEEEREPGRGYFVGRGISLSLENLTAFTAALQTIFLRDIQVAEWIGNLANNDIRRSLEIAKQLVTSPHLEVAELLKTYVAGPTLDLPMWLIKRALIKGKYNLYPTGEHAFIRNIYALDEDTDTSPLLVVRILQLLKDAKQAENGDPFITVDQVIEYFHAMLIDASVTQAILGRMLEYGLCLNYDPTVTNISHAGKIELSAAGFQHLRWGTRDSEYILSMMEITPIIDIKAFEMMLGLMRRNRKDTWWLLGKAFIQYIISEDTKTCKIPDHEAYINQAQITSNLQCLVSDFVNTAE